MKPSSDMKQKIYAPNRLWDQSFFRNRSHMQKYQNIASLEMAGFRKSGFDRLGHPNLPLGHVTPKSHKSKEKLTYGNTLGSTPVKIVKNFEFLERYFV